jgi:hypothetical protein
MSGLAWGAPVTVGVALGLDGGLGVGALDVTALPGGFVSANPQARAIASVDVSLSYRVNDLGPAGCAACGSQPVLDFGYDARAFFDAIPVAWNGAYGYIDSQWSPDAPGGGGPARSQNPFYVESTTLRAGDALTHRVNSGLMTFTFDTFVGNTLDVTGFVDIFVQAAGIGTLAQAAGVFDRTFDAGLESPVGLAFTHEVAGIAPVPEPAAWMLLPLGLALVGWRARRR